MKVRDVMTRSVKSCSPETNLAEAAMVMWENDCGVVPIVNNEGKVAGVITDRDIAIAVATKNRLASEITAGEVLPGKVFSATPDDDIKSALNTMSEARVRRLPVVDNDGSLQGILSINDVILQSTKGRSDLSHEDIVNTLKTICEHQVTRAAVG